MGIKLTELTTDFHLTLRSAIKDNLQMCNEGEQIMFKRMYSHGNLDADINDVVNGLNDDQLEWAAQQIENTLQKKGQEND